MITRVKCDCDQSFDVHPPGYHCVTCSIWGCRLPQTIRSHARPWFAPTFTERVRAQGFARQTFALDQHHRFLKEYGGEPSGLWGPRA